MKFLIVLSLAIVSVSALAYETGNTNNNNNNPSYEGSNEWESSPRNTANGRTQTDINGLTAESLGSMFQSQGQRYQGYGQQGQQGQRGRAPFSNSNSNTNTNNNEEDTSSLGYWASFPDSAAFDAKIKSRLSSSKVLGDKPEVRRKITQLAEDKFSTCKSLTDERQRACLGRVTGQVMQLVSAVENMARNPQ